MAPTKCGCQKKTSAHFINCDATNKKGASRSWRPCELGSARLPTAAPVNEPENKQKHQRTNSGADDRGDNSRAEMDPQMW